MVESVPKRYPDVDIIAGQKFKKNRHAHCIYSVFFKIDNQIEVALLILGNAQKFDRPVHMDAGGNVVDNLSQAFGYPVTVDIHQHSMSS